MLSIPYISLPYIIFEKCLPWRDNKYITIDGWGNFATLEWPSKFDNEEDKLELKEITKFPSQRISPGYFYAQPETGLIWAQASMKFLCYSVDIKKTCDFIPVISWSCWIEFVNSFSNEDLLFSYCYDSHHSEGIKCIKNYKYNLTDKKLEIYENGDFSEVFLWKQLESRSKYFLAYEFNIVDETHKYEKFFFFNLNTKEKKKNELTEVLSENLFNANIKLHIKGFSFKHRKLISDHSSLSDNCPIMIMWDDNYENVKVYPLKLLAPKDKKLKIWSVSDDCKWLFVLISYYTGLYGETLYKTGFIKISDEYPTFTSPLIISDDYVNISCLRNTSFIEHPKYGSCLLVSYEPSSNSKEKKECRLYKMKDIEKLIQEYFLQQTKKIIK